MRSMQNPIPRETESKKSKKKKKNRLPYSSFGYFSSSSFPSRKKHFPHLAGFVAAGGLGGGRVPVSVPEVEVLDDGDTARKAKYVSQKDQ